MRGLPEGWGLCSRTVFLGTQAFEISCWNNIVAVGSAYKDIIILDAITGSKTVILSGHTDEVNSVAFSSDGRLLVSGSDDMTVKLWDMQTGGAIRTFSGHTELVRSVSISADYATIASGSFDMTARLWNTQTGECYHIIKQPDRVDIVKFSPVDSQYFLSISGREIYQWDIGGHQAGPTFEGIDADFSPDGTKVVSRCGKVATVQNFSSREVIATFPVVQDNGHCCCFSPDGKLIAVTAASAACVWDITTSEPHLIETFIGHTNIILHIAFSSSSALVSVSFDQSVKFWKIRTCPTDVIRPDSISLIPATIMSITLETESGIFVTSDSDGVVKICDIFTGLCKFSFQTPAKGTGKRDIRLINGRLILMWRKGSFSSRQRGLEAWRTLRYQRMDLGFSP